MSQGKIKVLVSGSQGRMGKEILSLLSKHKKLELGGQMDFKLPGVDLSFLPPGSEIGVVVDFSSLEYFRKSLAWAVEKKVPFVSGTTGLSDKDREELSRSARMIPILWSGNMSLGLNVLLQLLGKVQALKSYDFQVEEFHHNKKIDSPSGTALMLQNQLEKTLERKLPEPLSGRGGGIFGIHKIWIMGEEETLVLEHTALNRRIFARGALSCASWLVDQSPGLYGIEHMVGMGDF
ncbi:MAG: 4-hydroxy-tetrahydrodipicolinate reductase [Bdellovibrionales bacterium]|nr:4-hydroxy-tetrahydrodipicolinate reductase [Bdellovibrionales bacterium]